MPLPLKCHVTDILAAGLAIEREHGLGVRKTWVRVRLCRVCITLSHFIELMTTNLRVVTRVKEIMNASYLVHYLTHNRCLINESFLLVLPKRGLLNIYLLTTD